MTDRTKREADMRKLALATLRKFMDIKSASDDVQRAMREIDPEADYAAIIGPAENMIVTLIDAILGDTLASYYLYECGREGLVISAAGKEYPIASVDDITAYLCAEYPISEE